MSRLDHILERHAERKRWTMHKVLWIAVATLIVVVGFCLLFTHVGMPDKPRPREHRVQDIKLMHAK